MSGADIIVALVLAAIIGGAVFYIVKAKKSGQKCIGCPHAGKAGCSCGRK